MAPLPGSNDLNPYLTRSKTTKGKGSTSNAQETTTQTMEERPPRLPPPPPQQPPQGPFQPLPQGPRARRALKDYVAPNAYGYRSPILVPRVDNREFELKAPTIQMVQSNQFSGRENEDPNSHITSFLEICDTFKIYGASRDVIHLRLFPFSLT
ncbi:unnamed protein product [Rhodiola kirilowii]